MKHNSILKGSDDGVQRCRWIYGLSPWSEIVTTWKAQRFRNWVDFHLQVKGGRHLLRWAPK
jgi:hypothetical protein